MHGQEIQVSLSRGQSIDDALINAAILELTPEETSRRIGGVLSPGRVMLRTRELLSGGKWLDDIERERATIMMLEKTMIEMNRIAETGLDDKMAKVVLSYAKVLFDRLDKRKAINDDILNTYDENVGRQIGAVVDLALTYMKGAVREQIDSAKWDQLVQEALALAWVEIEKKQVEA